MTANGRWLYPDWMTNVLSFKLENIAEDTTAILPCVDGLGLDQLVANFERANGYTDPAGDMAGSYPHAFSGRYRAIFLAERSRSEAMNRAKSMSCHASVARSGAGR